MIVTDAANTGNTALTSATANFTTDYIGNHVGLVSGGGTFLGTFELVAFVSSTQMTLDRNGPNASGMTMNLGGAKKLDASGLLSILPYVAGNTIWIKSGTYTITVNGLGFSITGDSTHPVNVIGYTTARGDGAPTRPVLQWGSAAIDVVAVSGSCHNFLNLKVDGGTGSGANNALQVTGFHNLFHNCVFRRGANVVNVNTAGLNRFHACTFKDSINTNPVVRLTADEIRTNTLEFCRVTGGLGVGIQVVKNAIIRYCRIYGNASDGIQEDSSNVSTFSLEDSVIWNNGRDGVRLEGTGDTIENIFIYRCVFGSHDSGYDINNNVADISTLDSAELFIPPRLDCNAFFTTGLGRYRQLPAGNEDLVLTASPFVSDTDFDISSNAAGAALSAERCTISWAMDTGETGHDPTTTSLAIGGIGVSSSTGSTGTMLSLWRELTNERNTTRISDTDVGRFYIQLGLNELNRIAHYHYTTSSTAVTLVAETQEYDVPADFVEVDWIQWNGQDLTKSSIDEWRRNGVKWRSVPSGNPQEYAIYGNKIVFLPKPSAAAVAVDDNPVIRYCSTPADFNANGPVQLNSQDYHVPVFHGVSQWFSSYPGGIGIQEKSYMERFTWGAQAIAADSARKGVSK